MEASPQIEAPELGQLFTSYKSHPSPRFLCTICWEDWFQCSDVGDLPESLSRDQWKAIQSKRRVVPKFGGCADEDLGLLRSMHNELFRICEKDTYR